MEAHWTDHIDNSQQEQQDAPKDAAFLLGLQQQMQHLQQMLQVIQPQHQPKPVFAPMANFGTDPLQHAMMPAPAAVYHSSTDLAALQRQYLDLYQQQQKVISSLKGIIEGRSPSETQGVKSSGQRAEPPGDPAFGMLHIQNVQIQHRRSST